MPDRSLFHAHREAELANRILELLVKESGHGLYDKALDEILSALDSEYGVFGYTDDSGDLVCPTMSRVFDQCEMDDKCVLYRQHAWTGLWGKALADRQSYFTNEAPRVPRGHMPIHNNLAVPIVFQGESIGLFNLANKPGGYTRDDQLLLEAVAGRIAPILYAWTQRELRDHERSRSAEKLQRLVDITLEERNRLEALLGRLQEAVLILDVDGDLVDVNDAAARLYGYAERDEMVRGYEESVIEKSAVEGGAVAEDDRPSARARRGEVFQNQEYEVFVPETGTRFIGSYGGAPVHDAEGNRIASVITIHDVTDLRNRVRLDEVLDEIGWVIQASLEVEDVLPEVLSRAAAAVGSGTGAVILREEGAWRVSHVLGMPDEIRDVRLLDEELPVALRAEKTGHVAAPASDDEADGRAGLLGKCVHAPLTEGVQSLGTIALMPVEGAEWRYEFDFLRKLATSVSLALRNGQLYQSQKRVASVLQEALLRVPERIDGIEFGLSYQSASNAALVGGDFYDIFHMGSTHLGILVGDVAGKGLDAAVATSLIKNTIRAYCSATDSPAQVLERTNALLWANSAPESFATITLGILDLRNGRFVYSNAGHTTGIVVRRSGEVACLKPNCSLVGAFAEAPFHNSEAVLELHDLVFLYTDGITEARRSGEFFGERRLFDTVCAWREGAPRDCVDNVLGEVHEFAGGRLQDDAALLALRWTGLEGAGQAHQQLLF